MRDLRVGLVGCGNIADQYITLGGMFAGYELRAVSDVLPVLAEEKARKYGLQSMGVEELLTSPEIDLVVNLTIPAAHVDVSRRALEAGKHCYSEKPLALTVEEGRSLLDLAAHKGLRLGSAPDTFLGAAHQEARHWLDSGLIGRVVTGTAHMLSNGMEHWHPNPDFFFQPGGGPMLDLGPYYVTDLIQLLGPVSSVSAMATSGFETRTIGSGPREGETVPVDVPTTVHAHLEFASGSVISLGTSWDVWEASHPHIELYGTEGTMTVPDPNNFGGRVTLSRNAKPLPDAGETAHPFGVPNFGREGEVANYRGAGLADMVRAIAEDRPHRCSAELALHAVDVMTGILRSAETRSWVDMETSVERPAPLPAGEAGVLLKPAPKG